MQQRHDRMLLISRSHVEPVNELVQSTDQAAHHLFESLAAYLAARD